MPTSSRQLTWHILSQILLIAVAVGVGLETFTVLADTGESKSAEGPVCLDDLPELPGKVTNSDFYGIHGKTGYPKGVVQQVRVKGEPQSHAISLCAKSNGVVHVEFGINKTFQTFRGKAGFLRATKEDGLAVAAQAPNWNGRTARSPVTFRVVGDGKTLWTSRPIQAFDDWQDFSVEVLHVRVLRLEVICEGEANFCWSAWADPVLLRLAPEAAPKNASPVLDKAIAKGSSARDTITEFRFSEPKSQLRWGGGGKFLIGHLPKAAQLIVYDIEQAREVKRIDLGSQHARFAANQTDLVVATIGKTLQRFDLATLERKALVPLTTNVEQARMGLASNGPLLLWSQRRADQCDRKSGTWESDP